MRVKVPGFLLALGAAMLLLGVLGGLYGIADGLRAKGDPWSTPGSQDVQLDPGSWLVLERVPSPSSEPQTPLRRISVYGPAGSVALKCASCTGSHQSLTLGSATYVGVASFQVSQPGSYKVTVTEPGQVVLVAPSMIGGLITFTGGLLLGIAGAVVCFVAIVWLVIGAATAPA